ncbi:hypothetical protein [Streptomyces griseoaurantiacus]|uniref:hypothetical protein n=1 Tax=Streptomyces griseoaurantiacus TaxID=68213 RepID=UPI0036C390BE
MDLDEPTTEPIDPEVEAEILHRGETADDRSPVSLNELKARLAASALQQPQ